MNLELSTGTCMMPSDTLPNDPKMWKSFEEGCEYEQLGTDWILGWGHSIGSMLEYIKQENSIDPKYLLDEWVLDYPVVIMEETSHSAWVNSEALRLAGIGQVSHQHLVFEDVTTRWRQRVFCLFLFGGQV